MSDNRSNQQILFLTDEQLRLGIEAMFFAYKGFTSDPDKILENYSYGRAHHRAIHFINQYPETTVNNLLDILGVTKQSLNRVLKTLVADELVNVSIGKNDRRKRNLSLTDKGRMLEKDLSTAQRNRMRLAYKAAGPDAVSGFRTVLDYIIQPNYPKIDGNNAPNEKKRK
ncbi:MAG: MarR family transcriptional regulator [Rhodobacteraceae bacterium]|nr:MarR family transcriptional regulator [Paracoccaceae bacterium]MBC66793.1 MarR family transcriptional regulator [Paracoccaceae bacterium]|tara:strand:+ start:3244 stop:3750 length:507 start_codon:yes stop_codon:yes gene_type:complete